MPFIVFFNFTRLVGSWSNDTHVSNKNIQELWEFVDRKSLDNPSDFHFSWIILGNLVYRSGPSVFICFDKFFFEFKRFILIGFYSIGIFNTILPIHISEFIERKGFSVFSYPLVLENYRSLRILSFNQNGYGNPYRRKKHEGHAREKNVGESFQNSSPDGHSHKLNLRHGIVSDKFHSTLLKEDIGKLYEMGGCTVYLAEMKEFLLLNITDIGSKNDTVQTLFTKCGLRFARRKPDKLDMWIFPIFIQHRLGYVSEKPDSGLLKIFFGMKRVEREMDCGTLKCDKNKTDPECEENNQSRYFHAV